ncbi:MAG: hypothetical protein ACFCD0_19385 [Gemmataceae bacterium]
MNLLRISYAILIFWIIPGLVQAQQPEGKTKLPTQVYRVESFNAVMRTTKSVAKAIEKPELVKRLDKLIANYLGEGGIQGAGIDPSRPWIAYGDITNLQSPPNLVVMLPILDQKKFRRALTSRGFEVKKGENGVRVVTQNLIPSTLVGYNVANKYVYIAMKNFNPIVPDNLVHPSNLKTIDMKALASGTIYGNRLPAYIVKSMKQLVKQGLVQVSQGPAPPGVRPFLSALEKYLLDQAFQALDGIDTVSMVVDVNKRTKDVSWTVRANPKKGSKFAKTVAAQGSLKSVFGNVAKKPLVRYSVNCQLPPELCKHSDALLDLWADAIAAQIKTDPEIQAARLVLKSLSPTLRKGHLDFVVSVEQTQDDQAGLIYGLRVAQGKKIEAAVKKAIKSLPKNVQQAIELDAFKIGGMNVHRMDMKALFGGETFPGLPFLGDGTAFAGIRNNAVFVVLGRDLKHTLKTFAKVKPGPTPMFLTETDLSAMRLMVPGGLGANDPFAKVLQDKSSPKLSYGFYAGNSLEFQLRTNFAMIRYYVDLFTRLAAPPGGVPGAGPGFGGAN